MKFKNYVNSYTKDNRIYSKEDISNMSVRDAYGKKRAILAQNRRIGVPSDAELRNSSNVIWVNPYRREDGTEVKGYWRSKTGNVMGSTGGIVGDNNIPPMDEQSDDIEDIIYGKKKRTGDIQDSDMDGGDEEISPVSATVDLIVALSQIFLKDTEIGEIIEAFAPVIKTIGEKVFGDDDLDFEIGNQESADDSDYVDSSSDTQSGTLTGGVSKDVYPEENTEKLKNIQEHNIQATAEQKQDAEEMAYIIDGYVSKSRVDDILKDLTKPIRDYENLTPIEKAQKWTSKHASWWTPSEYYGISEYLADDGKIPDKYLKHNDYYKLGDITDERTREIISSKVQRARRDCPVGPDINSPLEDVDVIVPKDDSDLVQEVKRSAEVGKFIENHRAELESGKTVNGSIEFKKPNNILVNYLQHPVKTNDEIGRFTAIHYADIVDAKMDKDGSVTMKLVDYYDFTKLDGNDEFDKLNNRAYKQQVLGKLKPYAIYKELKYKI